jgi:hypothetical protein
MRDALRSDLLFEKECRETKVDSNALKFDFGHGRTVWTRSDKLDKPDKNDRSVLRRLREKNSGTVGQRDRRR